MLPREGSFPPFQAIPIFPLPEPPLETAEVALAAAAALVEAAALVVEAGAWLDSGALEVVFSGAGAADDVAAGAFEVAGGAGAALLDGLGLQRADEERLPRLAMPS